MMYATWIRIEVIRQCLSESILVGSSNNNNDNDNDNDNTVLKLSNRVFSLYWKNKRNRYTYNTVVNKLAIHRPHEATSSELPRHCWKEVPTSRTPKVIG